jgi:hypothetical protein
VKIIAGLRNLSILDRIAKSKVVQAAMTTNAASFPNLLPSAAAYGTLITDAEAKVAAYNAGIATLADLKVARDFAMDALETGYNQRVGYVQGVAGDDPAIAALAGMQVLQPGGNVGPMPRVLDLLLSEGDHSGYVDAMWKPVYGAKSYEIAISPDPMSDTSWVFKMSSAKSSATLTGLKSGDKVWVRVRAIGADPLPGDWSDAAMKVVP